MDARELISPTTTIPRFTRETPSNVTTLPFALRLVLITLCIPVEFSFYLFGLRLTATRLIFLILTPVLLAKFARKLTTNHYQFVFSDLFIVLIGCWFIYAPANMDGLTDALNHAGPDVLEFCIGYMTTRLLLAEHGDALSFVDLLCRLIAIVALFGLLDPLTGHYVVHDFGIALTGYRGNDFTGHYDYRMGLLRAAGPVEHPIWFGYLCGIGLLTALAIPVRSRGFVIVCCSLGAFFALSSAPLQCTFLGVGLLVYNRVMSEVPLRWLILMGAGAIAIIAAFLISNSPVAFIISHLIFDPSSGYYRYWTWDRVIYYVSQSPWYGLGYGSTPEEINHSIDSLWLVLAIRFGLPGVALTALAILGATSLPTSGRKINLTPMKSRLGTTLGILIFLTLYVAFTVDLIGTTWILTGLLIGVRAHLGELGQLRPIDPRATQGIKHHRVRNS